MLIQPILADPAMPAAAGTVNDGAGPIQGHLVRPLNLEIGLFSSN